MPNLVLHHYPLSPYSQKLRSMLGYAQLSWQSALTREMPPRPVLAALAGGYRRVPIAQIGADIFCDSRLIGSEIAALSGKPALALDQCSEQIQAYVNDVDLNLFMSCILASGTKKFGLKVWRAMSLMDIIRFLRDRINIGKTATVKSPGARNPKRTIATHLGRMEEMLTQDFLFGAQPSHADFATYHCLWFVRDMGETSLVDGSPKTLAWMGRMKALGEGSRSEISGEQALEIAKAATPRPLPAGSTTDPLVGKQVTIAPIDYAQVPTPGILVGATPTRWILAREEKSVGLVHVHFPRLGFKLTPA